MPGNEMAHVLLRYPRLRHLTRIIPEQLFAAEILPKVRDYEALQLRAAGLIPTVNLGDVLPSAAEHGDIELRDFLGQWGNLSVEELCKICLVARWLDPAVIFEIGTYNGLSTLQLALNAPHATVFTLDIAPDSLEAVTLDIGEIDRHLARKTGAFAFAVGCKFANTTASARIRQLWGNSTTFDFSPYAGSCNLVFIDAGHTYNYVMSDTRRALSLLDPRREGVILWHDYDQVLHPDVTRCLCDLAAEGLKICHLRNTNLAICLQRPTPAPGLVFEHAGYAVEDISQCLSQLVVPAFKPLSVGPIIEDPVQHVRVCFVILQGGGKLELIEPVSDTSPIRRLLRERRPGLYHCCFQTEDLGGSINALLRQGAVLTSNPVPATAYEGRQIAFLFSDRIGLVELVESAGPRRLS